MNPVKVCKVCGVTLTPFNRYGKRLLCLEHGRADHNIYCKLQRYWQQSPSAKAKWRKRVRDYDKNHPEKYQERLTRAREKINS